MTPALTILVVVLGILLFRRLLNKSADSNSKHIATLSTMEFVDKYNLHNGQFKGGSLCFYGHWFGKPYDNYHKLTLATFDREKSILKLEFQENEILTIWNPKDIEEFSDKITIQSADKILWQWYYYGRPQTPDNLFFIEVNRVDNLLSGQSNEDWYKPNFKDLNLKHPAILWA